MVIPRRKKGFLSGKRKTKQDIDESRLSQMIRERAYFLWQEQGMPHGQDVNNWIIAEKEIRAKVGR